MHNHRAEHWVVVAGVGVVQLESETQTLAEGQSVYIPIGSKHRLSNQSGDRLMVIEVQSGLYLGEDDIVRFEDKYGRISQCHIN